MKISHQWPVITAGCDGSGRMSLPYLCILLQETATMHADELGWGFDVLREHQLQWVLSRQWIRLHRLPEWKEVVDITTWPSGRGGITWNRDFRISDAEGRELGVATSLWFVMDRDSRRPKPAPFGRDMVFDGVEKVRDTELKPLPSPESPRMSRTIVAGYHDIDVHDHVNNVRYVTWMLDGLDSKFIKGHEIRELEINFLSEGFLGDELEVRTSGGNESRLQSLVRGSDGAELCRMRSEWGAI